MGFFGGSIKGEDAEETELRTSFELFFRRFLNYPAVMSQSPRTPQSGKPSPQREYLMKKLRDKNIDESLIRTLADELEEKITLVRNKCMALKKDGNKCTNSVEMVDGVEKLYCHTHRNYGSAKAVAKMRPKHRCPVVNDKGKPCQKFAMEGIQYCYTHRNYDDKPKEKSKCKAVLVNGKPCKQNKSKGDYCRLHSHKQFLRWSIKLPVKELESFKNSYSDAREDELVVPCQNYLRASEHKVMGIFDPHSLAFVLSNCNIKNVQSVFELYVANVSRHMINLQTDDDILDRLPIELVGQLLTDKRKQGWDAEQLHYKIIGAYLATTPLERQNLMSEEQLSLDDNVGNLCIDEAPSYLIEDADFIHYMVADGGVLSSIFRDMYGDVPEDVKNELVRETGNWIFDYNKNNIQITAYQYLQPYFMKHYGGMSPKHIEILDNNIKDYFTDLKVEELSNLAYMLQQFHMMPRNQELKKHQKKSLLKGIDCLNEFDNELSQAFSDKYFTGLLNGVVLIKKEVLSEYNDILNSVSNDDRETVVELFATNFFTDEAIEHFQQKLSMELERKVINVSPKTSPRSD